MTINISNFYQNQGQQISQKDNVSYLYVHKTDSQVSENNSEWKVGWSGISSSYGYALSWESANSASIKILEPGNYFVESTISWLTSSLHNNFGRRLAWIDKNDESLTGNGSSTAFYRRGHSAIPAVQSGSSTIIRVSCVCFLPMCMPGDQISIISIQTSGFDLPIVNSANATSFRVFKLF